MHIPVLIDITLTMDIMITTTATHMDTNFMDLITPMDMGTTVILIGIMATAILFAGILIGVIVVGVILAGVILVVVIIDETRRFVSGSG